MKRKIPVKILVAIFVVLNILALFTWLVIPKVYVTSIAIKVAEKLVKKELKPMVDARTTCLVINNLWKAYKENKEEIPLIKFGLGEEDARFIKGIRANILNEKALINSGFEVRIYVKEKPQVISKVSKALIAYLNAQISGEMETERQKTVNDIKAIDETLTYIDGVRRSIKSDYMGELRFNPAEIDTAISKLKLRKQELKAYLTMLKGYKLIGKAYIPQKPLYPQFGYNFIIANLLAIGICLLVILGPYLT